MGYLIKQSTTAYELLFLMVDSADHFSPKTGLSPTVTIRKASGSFASPSGAVSEIANGWYKVAGNATDSATLGPLLLHATASGADPVDDRYEVVAFDPQDATGLGLSRLDAAITTRLAPTTSGRTLDVTAGGEAGIDWANIGSPTATVALSGTTVATTQKVDVETIKTNPVVNGGTVTFPTGATLASTTNITSASGVAVTSLAANSVTASALANDAVSEIANGMTTSVGWLALVQDVGAVQDTAGSIVDRLGAFSASGVNTVLGFFQALFRKNATLPSDIGGTFDPTTDSVEAIREKVDTLPSAATIATSVRDVSNASPTAGSLGDVVNTAMISAAEASGYAQANGTKLGTVSNLGSGATIAANLVDIESQTDDIGAAGAGLTAIPKTGYKLASDGLDSVATTAPSGVASNFREMVVQTWRRWFKKAVHDQEAETLKTYADNGTTVITTQELSEDAEGVETQGAAS